MHATCALYHVNQTDGPMDYEKVSFQHKQNGRLVAVEKRPLDQGIYLKI